MRHDETRIHNPRSSAASYGDLVPRSVAQRVYKRALELVDIAKLVMEELPTGYGFLADQIRRASSSVVLNFSEGYPKSSIREQRRFFRIAKASCYEVSAILDVAERFGVISRDLHARGKDVADHVAAMLTRFR